MDALRAAILRREKKGFKAPRRTRCKSWGTVAKEDIGLLNLCASDSSLALLREYSCS